MSLPSDAKGTLQEEIEACLQENRGAGADPDQGKDRGPNLGNTGVLITEEGLKKDGHLKNRRKTNPQRTIREGLDLLVPDQDLQSKKRIMVGNLNLKEKLMKELKLSGKKRTQIGQKRKPVRLIKSSKLKFRKIETSGQKSTNSSSKICPFKTRNSKLIPISYTTCRNPQMTQRQRSRVLTKKVKGQNLKTSLAESWLRWRRRLLFPKKINPIKNVSQRRRSLLCLTTTLVLAALMTLILKIQTIRK